MLNLDALDFSLKERNAVQEKTQRLQEALRNSTVTPESLTKAMLDCGRQGDYEALLELNCRIKKGIDALTAERRKGLAGRDTTQLEPTARNLTDQLVDEARILWNDPSDAQAAADTDPFLTAAVLNWAQEEGDIQSDLPPEVLGIQAAAANQAAKCLIQNDWDWQAFWSAVLETVTLALLLVGTGLLFASVGVEVTVASAEILAMAGYGTIIAAAVTCFALDIVDECWDELLDFFARVKNFWLDLFRVENTREDQIQEAGKAADLPAVEAESAAQSYA